MEEMDKKQKSKYIKEITLNIVMTLGIIALFSMFILPKYDTIGELTQKINETNAAIANLKTNGVNATEFETLAARYGRKKDLSNEVFSDKDKLAKVLAKPAGFVWDYPAWTLEQAGKIDGINSEIEKNNRILGNIIPNYTNAIASSADDWAFVKNQVTLQSFINYVEKDIIGKYSLESFAPIGINNIAFDKSKTSATNIGSFSITLDFAGKNSDIYAFVEAIQKSWELSIRNGKLISNEADAPVTGNLSELSNLLITIDSLNLTNILRNDASQNKGTIVLEFYVEGMNYQKILLLRATLMARYDGLKKKIKSNGDLCNKGSNPICQDSIGNGAVTTIKNLLKNMTELQPRIDGLKKGGVVTDINRELDDLFILQSTLENIENTYTRNESILIRLKNTRK